MMKTPREKYYNDPNYNSLVKVLLSQIQKCQFTPSELREAVILACILYEEQNVREMVAPGYPENVLDSLNIIRDWTYGNVRYDKGL